MGTAIHHPNQYKTYFYKIMQWILYATVGLCYVCSAAQEKFRYLISIGLVLLLIPLAYWVSIQLKAGNTVSGNETYFVQGIVYEGLIIYIALRLNNRFFSIES